MSTEGPPGRTFYGAFAVLVLVLGVGILVLSLLVSTSGPRVRHIVAQNTGDGGLGIVDQRLTVFFDRPVEANDPASAVEIRPETRRTVTQRGQQVTISFDQNLLSDTEYAVTVGPDLEDGAGTRMDRGHTYEFRTAEPSFTFLKRDYGPGTLDEIVERVPSSGEQRILFEEDRISRFARNKDYLVVTIPREGNDELRLVPTGPGENDEIELPSGDRVSDLEFSPTDDRFVFLTEPGGGPEKDSGRLYGHDIGEGHTYSVELAAGR
jgi:dipeptidyl aminopeptidase/acylaminoacyl peptidase